MNCVNYVKKTVCMVLMLAFVLISCLGAFATSENPKKLGILASSIKITDTKVEYIEYKDDGAYFVEETISGNIITSDFYKISNGKKIHSSQIISSVSGKNVISRETDANGQVTTYSVKGIVSRDTNEKSIVPYAIRTDNYSISLVGKKVTICISCDGNNAGFKLYSDYWSRRYYKKGNCCGSWSCRCGSGLPSGLSLCDECPFNA